MSLLFADGPLRPRSRSTTGLWLSVGLHALAAGVLIALPMRASERPPAPRMQPMRVFLEPVTMPAAPVVTPRLPLPAAPPPIRALARTEVPKPAAVAPTVATPAEPAPPVPTPATATEPHVETAVIQRPPETGLFERTAAVRTSQPETAVATGQFGSAPAAPRDAAHGPVATGAFGNGVRAQRAATVGDVQVAAFDRRASAPVQPVAAASTRPVDRPVAIVFKPTPEYTDEARRARIEGTVSLELEFTAGGDVRVVRVVRGLGHGLDEAAQRAALRIRFTPAHSDDRPVDSRATVHITFRLS